MEGAGDASMDEQLRKAAADAMLDIGGGGAGAAAAAPAPKGKGMVHHPRGMVLFIVK